jgi:hypothetical protein
LEVVLQENQVQFWEDEEAGYFSRHAERKFWALSRSVEIYCTGSFG